MLSARAPGSDAALMLSWINVILEEGCTTRTSWRIGPTSRPGVHRHAELVKEATSALAGTTATSCLPESVADRRNRGR